eukprot:5065755-Amphidinium_carterae.1
MLGQKGCGGNTISPNPTPANQKGHPSQEQAPPQADLRIRLGGPIDECNKRGYRPGFVLLATRVCTTPGCSGSHLSEVSRTLVW